MTKINTQGLFILKDNDIAPYDIDDSRMIICGVPGAFTPGCTKKHLPGFAKHLDELKKHGIQKVIFVAVNDAFVMDEWNKIHGDPQIDSVSDPLAVFSKSIGKDVDFGETMGARCDRFALLIEDKAIVKEFKNPFIEGVLEELVPEHA